MDRIIDVGSLGIVGRAIAKYPDYMQTTAPQKLYQAVNDTAMNDVKKRTPLATKTRYAPKRKKGSTVSGKTGMLRRSNDVRVKGTSVQIGTLRMDVPYAVYVHEAKKPAEGEYWSRSMKGRGRGWTTHHTGNKYIEKPVRDNRDRTVREFVESIDADLKGMGL